MYRLFYNPKTLGDVLFVLVRPSSKPDFTKKSGDIAALYEGNELVGINLFEASKHVELSENGVIFAPSATLIESLNKCLVEAGIEPLSPSMDSGYKVAKVLSIEEHPLDERLSILTLDLGEEKLSTVTRYSNYALGSLLVACVSGSIRKDGTIFEKKIEKNIPIECELCSETDLNKGDDYKNAFIVEGLNPGDDYFLGAK